VTGGPDPELKWYLDGVVLSSSAEVSVTKQGSECSLVISEVLGEDEGQYTVTAINPHGTASTTAYLTVCSKSQSVTSPQHFHFIAFFFFMLLYVCIFICP